MDPDRSTLTLSIGNFRQHKPTKWSEGRHFLNLHFSHRAARFLSGGSKEERVYDFYFGEGVWGGDMLGTFYLIPLKGRRMLL